MRKSVELFSGFFPMSMPVVEKKIVKHSGSGRGSAVQIQRPAPFVVEIGYMAAVVIAVRSSVMGIILHLLYSRMIQKIFYTAVELAEPCQMTFSSF